MSDSLWPHGLQHAWFPCSSPTPWAYSNSCPSSWWRHPTISSSVVPFSSHLQSFPASGSFQISQFFASGGQTIGVSASASVLPMNIQDWSPLGWTGWISLLGGDSQESSPTQFKSTGPSEKMWWLKWKQENPSSPQYTKSNHFIFFFFPTFTSPSHLVNINILWMHHSPSASNTPQMISLTPRISISPESRTLKSSDPNSLLCPRPKVVGWILLLTWKLCHTVPMPAGWWLLSISIGLYVIFIVSVHDVLVAKYS